MLPGDWVVTGTRAGAGAAGPSYLLDRGRGRYFGNSRYDAVLPAPTGSLVAMSFVFFVVKNQCNILRPKSPNPPHTSALAGTAGRGAESSSVPAWGRSVNRSS